jgi:type I protein arginine methyltransferase
VSPVIEEHRLYLRDRRRLSAYRRALRQVVKAGDVVVDLASGTGILGMLACRAGASRVYAIEQDPIAGLGRRIARANHLDHLITGIRGTSRTVALPERADVVVCDQMGPFGIDANLLDVTRDARVRFLRPGGTLVPSRVELMLAAVEHPRLIERLTFWGTRPAGFDFGAAAEIAANNPCYIRLRPEHLLSAPVSAAAIDLMCDAPSPIRMSAELHASRSGTVHGIGGWFSVALSPAVSMTNSPVAADRVLRRQIVFPVFGQQGPIAIEAGAPVRVALQILPAADMYSWDVQIAAECVRHTTLRGMMLAREDLARTHPGHRPVRSPGAEAELTVLRLCDGRHTLGEIERAVFEAHRELFASPSEASAFVAGVLARGR